MKPAHMLCDECDLYRHKVYSKGLSVTIEGAFVSARDFSMVEKLAKRIFYNPSDPEAGARACFLELWSIAFDLGLRLEEVDQYIWRLSPGGRDRPMREHHVKLAKKSLSKGRPLLMHYGNRKARMVTVHRLESWGFVGYSDHQGYRSYRWSEVQGLEPPQRGAEQRLSVMLFFQNASSPEIRASLYAGFSASCEELHKDSWRVHPEWREAPMEGRSGPQEYFFMDELFLSGL